MIALTCKNLLLLLFLGSSATVAAAAFSSRSNSQRVFVSTPTSKYPQRFVGDCMTPIGNVVTVTPDMSVDETLKLFLQHGIPAAPVVAANHKNAPTSLQLLGIVSSFDFLQKEAFAGGALLPLEQGSHHDTIVKYVDAAKKICAQRVEDVMTPFPKLHTTTPTTSMRTAAAIMAEHQLHCLPVLSSNDSDSDDSDALLAGLLTTEAVMKDLIRVLERLPPAKEAAAAELGELDDPYNLSP